MAGDWIKWCKGLASKLEVRDMARILGVHRYKVAAALMVLWEWCDDNISESCRQENRAAHVTIKALPLDEIDDITSVTGLAVAMQSVGWFSATSGEWVFPNYFRHNGQTSKTRQLTAERVAELRNARNVTNVTLKTPLEKRREEKKIKKTPTESSRKPNAIWDSVCKVFGLKPVTRSDCTRVGKVVRDLGQKGATPEEIAVRVGRYRKRWPEIACTPEALVKHWDGFATETISPAKPGGMLDVKEALRGS